MSNMAQKRATKNYRSRLRKRGVARFEADSVSGIAVQHKVHVFRID
jgi:hypothetical protein